MPVSKTSAPSASPQSEAFSGDPAAVRQRVEAMEAMLEGLFVVPGTNFRVGLDALLGVLPVGGTVSDVFFRSNTRNLKIIRTWLDEHHPVVVVM